MAWIGRAGRRRRRRRAGQASARAGWGARCRRCRSARWPLLRPYMDKQQRASEARSSGAAVCCYDQDCIKSSPFMRFLSPADRRGAVRVTRWNPLCDREEKGKAQREKVKIHTRTSTIKLGRIRSNRSPGIGGNEGHLLPSRLFLD